MGKVLRHLAVCGVLVLGALGCKSNNPSYPTTGGGGVSDYHQTGAPYTPSTATYTPQGTYQMQPGAATNTYTPSTGATGYPAGGAGAGYPSSAMPGATAGATGGAPMGGPAMGAYGR